MAAERAGDERVAAVLAVLGGRPLAAVATRHGVAAPVLQRWVDSFLAAGREALAGGPASNQAPERFLTVLAHEVRTPLAAAVAGLRLLDTDRLDPAARHEVYEMVSGRLRQLSELCSDVLDAASVALGRLDLDITAVDVQAGIEVAAAAAADPRLDFVPGDELVVCADGHRLQQMLTGLIGAALRHGVGRVWLDVGADATHARVTVSGHAREPVTAERASRWLEPFGGAAADAGNGLGLYVVRALAVAHAGTSGIDSSPCDDCPSGQDLHFWVRLPLDGPVTPAPAAP